MAVASADRHRRVIAAVLGITAVALVLRFVVLGDRVAHWDEARVAFWILDYADTGAFEYRPIIHGPLYHHVNPFLFDLFGATDAAMRILPALVGGLLPLTALLFRDRLRRVEVVALAGFLALNPVLLYYSRFMRGDPLVGAFMFAAFAFVVRAIDTGNQRHIVAAFTLAGLGFTAKENAILYVLCWGGAAFLLLDHKLYVARFSGEAWGSVLSRELRRVGAALYRVVPAILAGVLSFLLVIVWAYAPRSPDPGATALNNVASNPMLLPGVVFEATVGSWEAFYGTWIAGNLAEHSYVHYLGFFVETLAFGAAAVTVLGVVGFLVERYTTESPRPLVLVGGYWGIAALLGYPAVTDIQAPWAMVHIVLPLAIPASVGIGLLVRWGLEAFADDDRVSVGLAALVVLLIVGQVVAVGGWAVFLQPQSPDNQLVQYAQPADEFHPTFAALEAAAENHEGTDVLLYGNGDNPFVRGGSIKQYPGCSGSSGWFNLLPVPWYLDRVDATVECVQSSSGLDDVENPPIVIAQLETAYRQEGDETVRVEVVPSELTERYPDYNVYVGKIRTTDMQTVVMIDPTRVPASAASELTENPLLVGPGEYGLGGSDGTAVEESGDGGQSPASGEVTALRVTNG